MKFSKRIISLMIAAIMCILSVTFLKDAKIFVVTDYIIPNVMLVPIAPNEIDEVTKVKTLFSEDLGQFIDNEKAVLLKTKTGKTTFSTIVLPMNAGEDFEVTTTKLSNDMDENEVNMFSFTVTNKGTGEARKFLYYHLNDASLKTTVKVGNYTTDAQTLLVEEYADTGYGTIYVYESDVMNKGYEW